MPIHITWDDRDRQVMRYVFVSPWTWDDYFDVQAIADDMRAEAPSNAEAGLTIILDMTASRALPKNTLDFVAGIVKGRRRFSDGVRLRHLVIVGMNRGTRYFIDALMRLFPGHNDFIIQHDTLDAAYEALGIAPEPAAIE